MEIKRVKPISAAQIRLVYTLLDEQGLTEEKETMVHSISDGRTTSVRELNGMEAKLLIDRLKNTEGDTEKRKVEFRAIYGLAWKIGIIYGDTDDDYRMNIAKLNMFCRERGTVKKNLTEQNLAEMRKTHRQFEAIYKKHSSKAKAGQ